MEKLNNSNHNRKKILDIKIQDKKQAFSDNECNDEQFADQLAIQRLSIINIKLGVMRRNAYQLRPKTFRQKKQSKKVFFDTNKIETTEH